MGYNFWKTNLFFCMPWLVIDGLAKYFYIKGVVNCQNSRDKGPPEGNSARG